MTKQGVFRVEQNNVLAKSVYIMKLRGDTGAISAPGQFVNIALPGRYLRRPISVCNVEGDLLTLVYKTVGGGTGQMSRIKAGEELDLLTGLGNGYDLAKSGKHPALLAGGVGAPPLYLLAKRLLEGGKSPAVVLGFRTKEEVFLESEFRALGCKVYITTEDGSAGTAGRVTDALPLCGDYDYSFACGPEAMLRAVYDQSGVDGQYSFERRMGCGFGACMGCSMETKNGPARVCRDGPVFEKEVILW